MSDKYAAITAHWGQFPVQLMCRALDVSLSGYYEAKARIAHGPSARAQADEQLLVLVRAALRRVAGATAPLACCGSSGRSTCTWASTASRA